MNSWSFLINRPVHSKSLYRVFVRCICAGSVVIAIVAGMLWGLSYRPWRTVSVDSHALHTRVELHVAQESLFLQWAEIRKAPDGGWEPTIGVSLEETVLGFGVGAAPGDWIRGGEVALPYWGIIGLAMLPTVPFAARYFRLRRRRRGGLCLTCGYDLRESKERCPECGTMVMSGKS